MSIFRQKEDPDLEKLRYLAAMLLDSADLNGFGMTTYIYKEEMLEEIIKCFYGEEEFKRFE